MAAIGTTLGGPIGPVLGPTMGAATQAGLNQPKDGPAQMTQPPQQQGNPQMMQQMQLLQALMQQSQPQMMQQQQPQQDVFNFLRSLGIG